MGLIETNEMLWVVDAVESALADLGRRVYSGEATKIFSQTLREELA